MKKLLICLLILAVLAAAVWFFREPILDFLPIDRSGWQELDGDMYLLDEDGDPRTGWISQDGSTYFFREDGVMHTGWLEQSGARYYFTESGRMVTLWQEVDGLKRCFASDGKLRTGLWEDDGKRYYLDGDGSPITCFLPLDGRICYIAADGLIRTGWLEENGSRYYLDAGSLVHTGWLEEEGLRYYFNPTNGHMVTGWTETPEGTFYLHPDGALATGLTEIDGILHNLGEDGAPVSGWAELDGQRHYFGEDGLLYAGWLEEDGLRYYLLEGGIPAVGKLILDGQAYFFSSTGMNFTLVNPWHFLPEGFEPELTDAHGARLDPVCQDALGRMLEDCRAAGFNPRIVSSYRSIADQRANLQNMIESMDGNYAAATQIVAVPGTSEHHLGLAFDIVDSAYPKLNHQQAEMPAQKWLMEHCWEYGFILRYPENTTEITGIIWEPWHYRYVGVEMALEIRDLGGITLEEYIDALTNDGTTCGGKTPSDE